MIAFKQGQIHNLVLFANFLGYSQKFENATYNQIDQTLTTRLANGRYTLPNPCTDVSILQITSWGWPFSVSIFFCRFLQGLRRFEGALQSSKVGGGSFEFFCLWIFVGVFTRTSVRWLKKSRRDHPLEHKWYVQKWVKDYRINGQKKICLAFFLCPPSAHHCAGSHFRRKFATILLMGKWPGWIRAWRCSLCQLVGQSVHLSVHPSHSPTCHDPKGVLEEVVNCFRCS